jgi:hypothetical protein
MTDDTTPEGGQRDPRCGMCEYVYAKLIDAQADLAAQSSRLRSLEQRLRDLEGTWRRDADYRGGSPACGSCKTECADELSALIDQG